jgi:hypothetical protein
VRPNVPAALTLLLGLSSCDDHTGATEGLTFFEHPDYQGSSVTLAGDFSDFDDLRGPCGQTADRAGDWDDCISSVMVSPGWSATVFEHDDYEGETLEIRANIADLDDVRGPCGDDWDDCISSIRFRRP